MTLEQLPPSQVKERLSWREHAETLTPQNYRTSSCLRTWAGYWGSAWVEREGPKRYVAWRSMGPGGFRAFRFRTLRDALAHVNRSPSPHAVIEMDAP